MRVSVDVMEALFDALPDVVFFVKDMDGRYTHANLTLVQRLGMKQRAEIIGHLVTELFPSTLGRSYAAQDRRVLRGEIVENQLELHLFPSRAQGWCLTCKRPLLSRSEIRGVVGISRDLGRPDGRHPTYTRLGRVLAYLQEHYADSVRVGTLAELAEVSVAQLERHFQRVFQLTPRQMLTKLRIEAAMRLLSGPQSIAAIALTCGFTDQSAFARQFKMIVGMPPREYRAIATRAGN